MYTFALYTFVHGSGHSVDLTASLIPLTLIRTLLGHFQEGPRESKCARYAYAVLIYSLLGLLKSLTMLRYYYHSKSFNSKLLRQRLPREASSR